MTRAERLTRGLIRPPRQPTRGVSGRGERFVVGLVRHPVLGVAAAPRRRKADVSRLVAAYELELHLRADAQIVISDPESRRREAVWALVSIEFAALGLVAVVGIALALLSTSVAGTIFAVNAAVAILLRVVDAVRGEPVLPYKKDRDGGTHRRSDGPESSKPSAEQRRKKRSDRGRRPQR